MVKGEKKRPTFSEPSSYFLFLDAFHRSHSDRPQPSPLPKILKSIGHDMMNKPTTQIAIISGADITISLFIYNQSTNMIFCIGDNPDYIRWCMPRVQMKCCDMRYPSMLNEPATQEHTINKMEHIPFPSFVPYE